jgi:FG-GAP repeat
MRRLQINHLLALLAYSMILLSLAACGAQRVASITLEINGLPIGVQAAITVTGPDSFKKIIAATETLENLSSGTYTIQAENILQADIYFPDKRQQAVAVKAGERASSSITYSKQNLSKGSLDVTISGLPASIKANVNVTGPNGFSKQLNTSSVLSNLEAGDYTMTAQAVTVEKDSYTPAPPSQTITVSAGKNATLTVMYSSSTVKVGQLAIVLLGLPTNKNASITITGPDGFNQTVLGSITLENLQPGDYSLSATEVKGTYTYHPQPKTQTVKVIAGPATSATLNYVPTIVAVEPNPEDRFGQTVATNGEWLAIGSPNGKGIGDLERSGVVYLYRLNDVGEWTFVKKLAAKDASANAGFGTSLTMKGNRLVVGSPYHDYDTNGNGTVDCNQETMLECGLGAAYVFEERGGEWEQVERLTAKDWRINSYFGGSVALDGDKPETSIIVVGAGNHSFDGNKNGDLECNELGSQGEECGLGAAYVFGLAPVKEDELAWSQLKMLSSDAPKSFDQFGRTVAVSKDTVVVGSPLSAFDANSDGKIVCESTDQAECALGIGFVFVRNLSGENNFGLYSKLTSSEANTYNFAYAVAMSDDTLVVASDKKSLEKADSYAHVFQRGPKDTWNMVKLLQVEDEIPSSPYTFGSSVAVNEDLIMLGTPYASFDSNGDGKLDCVADPEVPFGLECALGFATLFKRDEGGSNMWGQVRQLKPSDGVSYSRFGHALALHGTTLVVGAPGYEALKELNDMGTAYTFVTEQ